MCIKDESAHSKFTKKIIIKNKNMAKILFVILNRNSTQRYKTISSNSYLLTNFSLCRITQKYMDLNLIFTFAIRVTSLNRTHTYHLNKWFASIKTSWRPSMNCSTSAANPLSIWTCLVLSLTLGAIYMQIYTLSIATLLSF